MAYPGMNRYESLGGCHGRKFVERTNYRTTSYFRDLYATDPVSCVVTTPTSGYREPGDTISIASYIRQFIPSASAISEWTEVTR